MKRHEILGNHIEGDLAAITRRREARFEKRTKIAGKSQQLTRESDLDLHVVFAVKEHLGYGPIENLESRLQRGVDRSVQYFTGDWWKSNESDQVYMDKSREDRALIWLKPYTHSLFLCGITGRWEEAAQISDWIDEKIELEYTAGQVADEYMYFFIYVASKLRSEPLAMESELSAAIQQGRARRPRFLLDVFHAALASDQKEFDRTLTKSIAHFLKHVAEDVPNCNYWVGIAESFLWFLAEENGLTFPSLPEKSDAAVVRRQTIGL